MKAPPAGRTGVDRFRRWVPVLNVVLALWVTANVTAYAVRGDWFLAAFWGIFGAGVSATVIVEAWPAPFPRRQVVGMLIGPATLCLVGVLFGALGTYGLVIGRRPLVAVACLVVGALCVAGGVFLTNRLRKLQHQAPGPPGP
jgi:hypothetical protein